MISRFQPARLMAPLVLILVLIAFSWWLNPEPWRHLGIATLSIYIVSFASMIGLALVMRARSYLRMDERGLEIKYIVGAPRFFAWADIEAARVFKKRLFMIPVLSTIRLRLRPSARSGNAVRRVAGSLIGADVTFLAAYDESPQQLLEKILMFQRNHSQQ